MFAFSQIEARNSGLVTDMPTPIGRYLGAMWDQGYHDSAYSALSRMTELTSESMDEDSPMLDPEIANKRFGIPGRLKFDAPVREGAAKVIESRKRAEMDRQFLLSQGSSAARFVPGMATALVASILNPVDLAMLFIPFVGEERLAASASVLGRGVLRQRLAKGLVSVEGLARAGVPAPRLTGSLLQGTLGQAVFEIPNLAASWQDKADYGMENALINVAAGGAFAGAIHGALSALGRVHAKLNQNTKEAMVRKAINDFLEDKVPDVSKIASVDENVVRMRVTEDYMAEMKRAAASVTDDQLKAAIKARFDDKVTATAVRVTLPDGTEEVFTSYLHLGAYEKANEKYPGIIKPEAKALGRNIDPATDDYAAIPTSIKSVDEGFVTEKGKYVSRQEAAIMAQWTDPAFNHIGLENAKKIPELEAKLTLAEELGDEGKIAELQRELELYRAGFVGFFEQPNVQKLMEEERVKRVNEAVAEAKANWNPEAAAAKVRQELLPQKEAGKTLTPEQITEHTKQPVAQTDELATVEAEAAEIFQNLQDDVKAHGAIDGMLEKLDKAIEALGVDPKKMMIDPFLVETLGKPLLRMLLIAVRAALQTTKDVTLAVDAGIEWLKKNWGNAPKERKPEVEDITPKAAKTTADEQTQEIPKDKKGMNRRGFLEILGKAVAATQVPINPANLLKTSKASKITKIFQAEFGEYRKIANFADPEAVWNPGALYAQVSNSAPYLSMESAMDFWNSKDFNPNQTHFQYWQDNHFARSTKHTWTPHESDIVPEVVDFYYGKLKQQGIELPKDKLEQALKNLSETFDQSELVPGQAVPDGDSRFASIAAMELKPQYFFRGEYAFPGEPKKLAVDFDARLEKRANKLRDRINDHNTLISTLVEKYPDEFADLKKELDEADLLPDLESLAYADDVDIDWNHPRNWKFSATGAAKLKPVKITKERIRPTLSLQDAVRKIGQELQNLGVSKKVTDKVSEFVEEDPIFDKLRKALLKDIEKETKLVNQRNALSAVEESRGPDAPKSDGPFMEQRTMDDATLAQTLKGGTITAFHGGSGTMRRNPTFFTLNQDGAVWFALERGREEPMIVKADVTITKPARRGDVEAVAMDLHIDDPEVVVASGYSAYGNELNYLYVPRVIDELKKRGFDGVIDYDALNNAEIVTVIPFEKSQIKEIARMSAKPDPLKATDTALSCIVESLKI